MSEELVTIISALVTLGVGMFAGFAWVIHRMDARFASFNDKFTAEIKSVDEKLTGEIRALDEKFTGRFDAVKDELTEVKIAVARIEGPPRHLITAR
ncbi:MULTISPECIES: hypothetical protein [Microbacterium]|uniref:hypothetical protein n=1 Tax=Microbacterium TaxID=33882 RepID=UPI00217EBAEC|nr:MULTISPECIES: hypothetical protein [Microbacterium]UWF77879.1 hypothetical protein JSY13_02105 [Microbacterium neungamense]WCM56055.1 hypothetical protein JRG78_02145 [Microbacterium sp. EF45047]